MHASSETYNLRVVTKVPPMHKVFKNKKNPPKPKYQHRSRPPCLAKRQA